ncbi:ABC transporter permease [Allofournierella sp.]|uniref:ABC transporter permease n=1 Tax=Allofournierella sp. TaxID=1940256 RepID=UPI003AB39487
MKLLIKKEILLGFVLALTLCCGGLVARIACSVPDGYILPELVQKGTLSATDGSDIAGYCLSAASCSYQGTTATVSLASTSGDMQALLQGRVAFGAFYRESAAMEENRWAVIDETLAVRFFMTAKACGRKLWVGDTEYTVCGVVKARTNGLEPMFADGLPRVYIPANSQEGSMEGKGLTWCGFSRKTDSKAGVAAALAQYSGAYVSEENIVDLTSLKKMAAAIRNTAVCALAVCALFLLKCVFHKYLQRGLGTYWKIVGPGMGLGAAAAAVTTFLLSAPPALLPSDNIFDLSHYWGEFLALLQFGSRQGGDVSFYISQCVFSTLLMLAIALAEYCLSAAIFFEGREKTA